jgi:hypothetical protein
MGSYEDRSARQYDRDMLNKGKYRIVERNYFLGMRPPHISEWVWRAYWEDWIFRDDRGKAMADAKAMAIELGVGTGVISIGDDKRTQFVAKPLLGRVQKPRYEKMGQDALMELKCKLFSEGRYPDIPKINGPLESDLREWHNEELRTIKARIEKNRVSAQQ